MALFGIDARKPIEVTPPGATRSVYLRHVTFREWLDIISPHRKLAGQDAPPELVAKTLAVVLSDQDGRRLVSDDKADTILDEDPQAVLWLYVKAFETVLRQDETSVQEAEKN